MTFFRYGHNAKEVLMTEYALGKPPIKLCSIVFLLVYMHCEGICQGDFFRGGYYFIIITNCTQLLISTVIRTKSSECKSTYALVVCLVNMNLDKN